MRAASQRSRARRLALGAVAVAAGVEGEAEIFAAVGAAVAMAAERGGPAALDGPHDLMLRPGDARAAAFDEAPAVGAEDVGHLQRGPAHDAAGSPSLAQLRSYPADWARPADVRVERWR